MTRETYDDFSQDYDRFVNWDVRLKAEIPFIETRLNKLEVSAGQPLRVLDAACGTGGHAIELARRGLAVVGADLSPKMVAKAAANARAAGVQVEWVSAAFGDLADALRDSGLFPFDALICLGNSLPHMLSLAGISRALQDFSRCLRPGGLLILQNRNFDAVMARKERWISPQARIIGDEEWLFLRFYDFDPDGLITFNIVRLYRRAGGDWQQRVSVTRLFPLLRQHLPALLEEAGFSDGCMYGLMDEVPFEPRTSENLVVTAHKTA